MVRSVQKIQGQRQMTHNLIIRLPLSQFASTFIYLVSKNYSSYIFSPTMFASTSALRYATRRVTSTSIRSISSASKANAGSRRVNEEYFRKALPLFFAGSVAIGATQLVKVGFHFSSAAVG